MQIKRITSEGCLRATLTAALFAVSFGAGPALADADADAREAEPIEIDPEFLQPRSTVETGILIATDDSYRAGDFSGLEKSRSNLLGNIDLRGRANWDSETSREWRFQGSNLGLGSRRLRFEYGSQGRYGLTLHFDQIPKLREDRGGVFFANVGDSTLMLPAGFVRGDEPGDLTTLPQSLRGPKIRHERRRSGGTFSLSPAEGWELALGFDRETKQGSKLIGSIVGTNGGNAVSVIAPEPIDYDNQKWSFELRNEGESGQFQLRYVRSAFENRKRALTWQSPFTGSFTVTDFAAKGMMPDNDYQQLSLAAGYALPFRSRVTFNAAYGTMEQDEGFLPYTINPAITLTTALPRASLDGRIQTRFMRLGIVSRPLSKLQLHASWRMDDRDNDTPRATYQYVQNDSGPQAALDSSNARRNVPYSYRSNLFEVGSSYNLARRTTLGLDYAFEITDRDFTEVDRMRESRLEATLNSRFGKKLGMRLKAGYAGRRGSTYESNEPFLDGRSPDFLATLATSAMLDNAPELRRSYLADRIRTEASARLSYAATESLTFAWTGRMWRDDYDRTNLGLTDVRSGTTTLDVSYDPSAEMHYFAFYSYQASDRDDSSVSVGANFAAVNDPTRLYGQSIEDVAHTVGLGARTEWLDGRLVLELDYTFTRTGDEVDVSTGSSLTAGGDLPENRLRRHQLRVGATYQLRENLSILTSYQISKLNYTDFAYEGVTPTNLPDLLTLGQGTPDNQSSFLSFAVRWTLD